MRLIAAVMTLLMMAAAGLASQKLWALSQEPLPQADRLAVKASAPGDGGTQADQMPPHQWAALFGELEPPAPPAPPPEPPEPPAPQAEPQPPKPPAPPVSSLGYRLKGVVRAGDIVWGLVSHPTGDELVRVGRELAPGVVVERIDADGLWVDNGGDAPELLGFDPS